MMSIFKRPLFWGVGIFMASLVSCTSSETGNSNTLWIYTSLYKDTIEDLTPRLKEAFPGVEFQWFQAGSEEIATKINAEMIAGETKADVLISSDRFWYEELASTGHLHSYQSPTAKGVPESLKNPSGYYSTLSIPVMVLVVNQEMISKEKAPKTFKELADPKWSKKITSGSPLESGTNFTTVAMLEHAYGWDYIKGLRKNEILSQGGNSAVIRRLQRKERPVGWVLLENLLRIQDTDTRLVPLYPEDGVVIQSNVIAITKKKGKRELAEKFVDWMYGKDGQEAMIRSYMYSPLEGYTPPKGAPPFKQIRDKSFKWTAEFIEGVVKKRDEIKEQFARIMFE